MTSHFVQRIDGSASSLPQETSTAISRCSNGPPPARALALGLIIPNTETNTPMKKSTLLALPLIAFTFGSCRTAETAATGTANTVGHAAQGVGRTVATAGSGVGNTVGNTVKTAGSGIAERDLKKTTVGTAATAGKGTVNTAVKTGSSHMKTTGGVLKDTGKTIGDTTNAASGE